MTKARILGIQIEPEPGNKQANLDKVRKFVEDYAWYKPDLIVLSEVFNSGVDHRFLQKLAETIPEGQTTHFFSEIAKKYSVNVVSGSYIEKINGSSPEEQTDPANYRNASVVFDRKGEIIGKYQKIHMFDYQGSNEGKYVSSGDRAVIVETDIGKIGLSICYDIRFPELFRALTYGGAEIITCCAAWPFPKLDHWITLNKARAIENTVYMIAVNQCGRVNPKRQNLGSSMLINPWGEVVAYAGVDEGVITGEIDLGFLRKTRENFPVLKDRNTEAYKIHK